MGLLAHRYVRNTSRAIARLSQPPNGQFASSLGRELIHHRIGQVLLRQTSRSRTQQLLAHPKALCFELLLALVVIHDAIRIFE